MLKKGDIKMNVNKEEKIETSKEIETAHEENENKYLVVLTKPVKYEGETYNQINLSGLEGLTGADLIFAQRALQQAGAFTTSPETDYEYVLLLVSRATKLPVELFHQIPLKDTYRIKRIVSSFLYGTD